MTGSNNNILNRSPWKVLVRSNATLERRFPYPNLKEAQAYLEELAQRGIKSRLVQLETSFQLRVRRKGVSVQHITFDTLKEAEQARLRIMADLSVSIVRDYAVAARTSLHDLMERYLTEVVPQHKGRSTEGGRIRRLMREQAFVDKPLAALTTEDLQEYIVERLALVKPATVDREVDVIAQVLNYAADVWKIAAVENPMKGLRRPKYFNERDRRLMAGEEEALLAAARQDQNVFLEPAIILALETAMRRGELLDLTRSDINLAQRYALCRETKNGRDRKVPLSKRAMIVLEALITAQKDENLREDVPLLNLTANALKKGFFERTLPRCGIENLHFHDLRHEAVSRFAESGRFQLLELQAISGHQDLRSLQRYVHLLSGPLANKLDGIALGTTTRYIHRGRIRTSFKSMEFPPSCATYEQPKREQISAPPESSASSLTADCADTHTAAMHSSSNVLNFADFAQRSFAS